MVLFLQELTKMIRFFFVCFFHFSCQPRKLADWLRISNTASVVIIILIKKTINKKYW